MERNRRAEMCMCGIDEQGIKDTTKGRKASGKTTQRNKTLTAGTRNNLPQCQLWPLLILLLLLLLLLPIRHIRISPHRAHIRHRRGYRASAHRRDHRRRAPILSLLTRRVLVPSIRIVSRIRIRMRSTPSSTSSTLLTHTTIRCPDRYAHLRCSRHRCALLSGTRTRSGCQHIRDISLLFRRRANHRR